MVWNKVKLQLEGFMAPALIGKVEYRASGYRYTKDKPAHCFITVNQVEIFNINDLSTKMKWFSSEQEIKKDESVRLPITSDEIAIVRQQSGGKIPEERLRIVTESRKLTTYAKDIMEAQTQLSKIDFQKSANIFLTTSVEKCLSSDDIILNVLAIIDRRVGKRRLQNMRDEIAMKHPVVNYFYELRIHNKS